MHAAPTRAGQKQTGHRRKAVALSAAALAVLSGLAGAALSATSSDPIETAALAPLSVPHELRIERTGAGREGLELSARLSETGNLIMRPIGWTVRRAITSDPAGGETILKREV